VDVGAVVDVVLDGDGDGDGDGDATRFTAQRRLPADRRC
jgi:hypothetical protein